MKILKLTLKKSCQTYNFETCKDEEPESIIIMQKRNNTETAPYKLITKVIPIKYMSHHQDRRNTTYKIT